MIGQYDQIQNIVGDVGAMLSEGTKSGAFHLTASGIQCSGLSYGVITGYGAQVQFDASRVVRAGTENKVC